MVVSAEITLNTGLVTLLVGVGISCIVAALFRGNVTLLGNQFPKIERRGLRVILGGLGVVLILWGLAETRTPASQPATTALSTTGPLPSATPGTPPSSMPTPATSATTTETSPSASDTSTTLGPLDVRLELDEHFAGNLGGTTAKADYRIWLNVHVFAPTGPVSDGCRVFWKDAANGRTQTSRCDGYFDQTPVRPIRVHVITATVSTDWGQKATKTIKINVVP
jgi:hypothetical protein